MLENNSRWPINSFVYLDVDFLRMLVVFKRRDRPLRGYDQVKVSTDRLSCWDHILRPNGDFIQLLLFSETSKKEHSKVSNRFLHPRRSKASINTSSTAATPAAHIIWKTPSRTLSLFSPLVYASLLGHKDQRDQGKRWGGQVGIKGQKKGERKKKKESLNRICRYGSLDFCPCPFTVLSFTFPHAPSLLPTLLFLSFPWSATGSDLWWLSSMFLHAPPTLILPVLDLSINL